MLLQIVSNVQHTCANLYCMLSCSLHAACRMHNVAVVVFAYMLRIGAVVLCTCVFAPLLLLEYNTVCPNVQPKCCAMYMQQLHKKKGLLSLPAAPSHAAPACCCYTCSLIRFLLALGPLPALLIVCIHRSNTVGYLLDLAPTSQKLLHCFGSQLCLCFRLLASCHNFSLLWPPPSPCM